MKTPSVFRSKNRGSVTNKADSEVNVLQQDAMKRQKVNEVFSDTEEEPLNTTQISTLKAFEQLRLSVISKINKKIVYSKILDHYKQLRNISWYHKLFYKLGCLRYNPDEVDN